MIDPTTQPADPMVGPAGHDEQEIKDAKAWPEYSAWIVDKVADRLIQIFGNNLSRARLERSLRTYRFFRAEKLSVAIEKANVGFSFWGDVEIAAHYHALSLGANDLAAKARELIDERLPKKKPKPKAKKEHEKFWDAARYLKLREMYEAGVPIDEIAEKFRRSRSLIYMRLKVAYRRKGVQYP